jgi:hypothetical protein
MYLILLLLHVPATGNYPKEQNNLPILRQNSFHSSYLNTTAKSFHLNGKLPCGDMGSNKKVSAERIATQKTE